MDHIPDSVSAFLRSAQEGKETNKSHLSQTIPSLHFGPEPGDGVGGTHDLVLVLYQVLNKAKHLTLTQLGQGACWMLGDFRSALNHSISALEEGVDVKTLSPKELAGFNRATRQMRENMTLIDVACKLVQEASEDIAARHFAAAAHDLPALLRLLNQVSEEQELNPGSVREAHLRLAFSQEMLSDLGLSDDDVRHIVTLE